jgi:hypothetical protein
MLALGADYKKFSGANGLRTEIDSRQSIKVTSKNGVFPARNVTHKT